MYIPGIYHRVPRDYSHITFEILIRIRMRIWTLNSCTWLPPWRWQGYKPTGWCRSSGFPGESIHMLLTKCLICSESTNFSNDYYWFVVIPREYHWREISFFSFIFFYCLIDLTQRDCNTFLIFLSRDSFSLSLSFSFPEKANKYEGKQINMHGNLKYV